MSRQYPPSPDARRALAHYLVSDLQINPMSELIPLLSGTISLKEENGMVSVCQASEKSLTFPQSLTDAAVPSTLAETAFARLVIHCLALTAPLTVVAAFVQSEHMTKPESGLCATMWQWMAYLHAAPQAVCTALRCLRPDLIQSVQHLYGGWLQKCRSPQHIASVLEDLVAATWHVESGSPACKLLQKLMHTAQVAAFPARVTAAADLVVDERVGILISKRDKSLLSLVLACGPDSPIAFEHIKAFSTAKKQNPYAFIELPHGEHPLDELQ